MSCDQRLCPGVAGCRCGAFMVPLFRDPHPTCARCRGKKCPAFSVNRFLPHIDKPKSEDRFGSR